MKLTKDIRRKNRVRARINQGNKIYPRLSVYRSNLYIYGQIIDDVKRKTLAAFWGKSATEVGEKLAQLALKKKISQVVFDRGGYRYHGRVKALAEGARKGGLKF